MTEKGKGRSSKSLPVLKEHGLSLAEAASGIGAFQYDLDSEKWEWRPAAAALFGFDPQSAPADFKEWQKNVFPDDTPKLRAALYSAKESGNFYVEFRVRARTQDSTGLPEKDGL